MSFCASRAAAAVWGPGSAVSRRERGVRRHGYGAVYFLHRVKSSGVGDGEGGYGASLNRTGAAVRGGVTLVELS